MEAASDSGLRTATLVPEYGGAGIDCLTTAKLVEELGKADLGVSVVIAQSLKIAQTLQAAATPEQQERFLPAFAADSRFLLAIGITEPETSSNYFIPFPSDFQTSATRVQDGWLISSKKHFISNGNVASLYLLFAQTAPGKGLVEGSTCFLIPRPSPGFSIGKVHDKMGERLANNAELLFDDCFVPDETCLVRWAAVSRCWLGSSRPATPTPPPASWGWRPMPISEAWSGLEVGSRAVPT